MATSEYFFSQFIECENFQAQTATIENLTYVSIDTLNVTNIATDTLQAVNATINDLVVTGTSNIPTLAPTNLTCNTLNASTATINNSLSAEQVTATNATITNLTQAEGATVTFPDIQNLQANTINTNTLNSQIIDCNTLNANVGVIGPMTMQANNNNALFSVADTGSSFIFQVDGSTIASINEQQATFNQPLIVQGNLQTNNLIISTTASGVVVNNIGGDGTIWQVDGTTYVNMGANITTMNQPLLIENITNTPSLVCQQNGSQNGNFACSYESSASNNVLGVVPSCGNNFNPIIQPGNSAIVATNLTLAGGVNTLAVCTSNNVKSGLICGPNSTSLQYGDSSVTCNNTGVNIAGNTIEILGDLQVDGDINVTGTLTVDTFPFPTDVTVTNLTCTTLTAENATISNVNFSSSPYLAAQGTINVPLDGSGVPPGNITLPFTFYPQNNNGLMSINLSASYISNGPTTPDNVYLSYFVDTSIYFYPNNFINTPQLASYTQPGSWATEWQAIGRTGLPNTSEWQNMVSSIVDNYALMQYPDAGTFATDNSRPYQMFSVGINNGNPFCYVNSTTRTPFMFIRSVGTNNLPTNEDRPIGVVVIPSISATNVVSLQIQIWPSTLPTGFTGPGSFTLNYNLSCPSNVTTVPP